jgi:hypothetical protein
VKVNFDHSWLPPHMRYPPGLRELAEEKGLTESQIQKVAAAWDTIRGKRPRTIEEWRIFWGEVGHYFKEE